MCYYTLQALQQLLWKPGSRHGFFVQPALCYDALC